jgi:hypothetical protein
MRISRHDVEAKVYTLSQIPDTEGILQNTFTLVDTIEADIQPVGSHFRYADYGIDPTKAGVKKMFFDIGVGVVTGSIVKSGKTYMVKFVDEWYDHQKAILEPVDMVIP